MSKAEGPKDLHQVVERFLDHTLTHRSEIVHKRYSQAMELLMSFLAVELLDPESPDSDSVRGPAGQLAELTPEVLRRYVGQFLTERLGGDARVLKRHLLATRAFLRYLTREGILDNPGAEKLTAVVRSALRAAERERPHAETGDGEDEDDPGDVQLFRVLHAELPRLDLENLVSEEVLEQVLLINPADYAPREQDICMMTVERNPDGVRARCLGVLDPAINFDEGATPEVITHHAFSDPDGELPDATDDLDVSEFILSPEDALEILAVEDRYAPRSVVQAVFDGYDEVRDELLEWVSRNDYRDTPFPGAGEAPANAARILSELGEMEIVNRLVEVLGDQDPLAEEAPIALARLGPDVLDDVQRVVAETNASRDRKSSAVWAMGYMAARHPAVRATVLEILIEIAEAGDDPAAEALQVISELRATELLPRIKRAVALGRLDLDKLGYTPELLEHQISSPNWGDAVVEALIPLLYLYPTEEELEELYTAVEDELEDWDPLHESDEEETELSETDVDPSRIPKRSEADDPHKADGDNVIPFTPNSRKPEDE